MVMLITFLKYWKEEIVLISPYVYMWKYNASSSVNIAHSTILCLYKVGRQVRFVRFIFTILLDCLVAINSNA